MVANHFESVAEAAKLPSVAADVVEDRLLYLGCGVWPRLMLMKPIALPPDKMSMD